jgi:hypothetical protein
MSNTVTNASNLIALFGDDHQEPTLERPTIKAPLDLRVEQLSAELDALRRAFPPAINCNPQRGL